MVLIREIFSGDSFLSQFSPKGTSGTKGSGTVDVIKADPNKLPSGWTRTDNNGFTHIRDENGVMRMRLDPPDTVGTPFPHKHLFDANGNSLDINGNIVPPNSPDAHIPLK